MILTLRLTLLSDATFGRGDGVAGLVDAEIEYDGDTGLPLVRGRTLKGLLVEECANILYSLQKTISPLLQRMESAAAWLFGAPGSLAESQARLYVGAATYPDALRHAVVAGIQDNAFQGADILEALTAIRRQTAVDEWSGAPAKDTLRSVRVLLRDTTLTARLDLEEPTCEQLGSDVRALLAACVKALRRGGMSRNRGRGRLLAELVEDGTGQSLDWFSSFQQALNGGVA